MGGNGSKAAGLLEVESNRRYKEIEVLENGVKVIAFKDSKTPTKMPEESHSPIAIYAMMFKKGNGLKSISVYGSDCKKKYEIHNEDHEGMGVHYHIWKNGALVSRHPISENQQLANLLSETLNCL